MRLTSTRGKVLEFRAAPPPALEGVTYEEVSYEGYAPHGVAVYVEALTDNRNRMAADVRHLFSKNEERGVFRTMDGGKTWKRFDRGMEVSGYHHNVRGGFLMLRPGLYSAGAGEARFTDFRFEAL